MGANSFCYLAGQTSIWDHLISHEFPFNPSDMDLAHKYAKAAHERGLPLSLTILPGHHHFSILDELARSDGTLVEALRDLIKLAGVIAR